MGGLLHDLGSGFKALVRTPFLSGVAVLTMGLGVAATTFGFSATYGVFLRGIPVRDSDRLMGVQRVRPSQAADEMLVPLHDYLEFRDAQSLFRDLAAGYIGTINVAGDEGAPERFHGGFVTANAFDGLGVSPVLGRTFRDGDDRPGAPQLLLLGYDVWQNRFDGDPEIVGRTLRVNGEVATVVGVMPEGFGFPVFEDVWVPLRVDPTTLPRGGGTPLLVWGYLQDGVGPEAATAELSALLERMRPAYPQVYEDVDVVVKPFTASFLPQELWLMTGLLMAVVLGVLVVAAANVANLLLARATVREREVAIRSALGADRTRLVRQLLAEAVALGLAGGLGGLGLAHLGLVWFEGAVAGLDKPYWFVYGVDGHALAFTLGVTLLAALVAGTVPALRASGIAVGDVLRDETRGSSSIRMGRFSTGLVVAEIAVSCGLMVSAASASRAFLELNSMELGFDVAPIVTSRFGLFESAYEGPEARNRFHIELLERLRAEPGAEAAALTNHLPGTGQTSVPVRIEGRTYPTPEDVPMVGSATVSDAFFGTFGVRLVEGRDFTSSEAERGGEPVVIVNRSFVARHLGGAEAVGRRIRVGRDEEAGQGEGPWMRIVGVAPDLFPGVEQFGQGGTAEEMMYRPLALDAPRFMSIAVRTRGRPGTFAGKLREVVRSADPDLPLYWVRPMRATLDEAAFLHRMFSLLFTTFGAAALFLAAVGLYGVMDFSVSSRVREVGVRIALGADPPRVLALVMRRVLTQVGLGVTIGLALGVGLTVPLSKVLVGVRPWDPIVSALIAGALALTAAAAALPPAIRALRIDPSGALRME